MKLTKKQVKAWLDTMSSDDVRPAFNGVNISTYQERTAVITIDGYIFAALDAPELAGHEGKFISRSDIAKWYKLAASKDVLSGETLASMAQETTHKLPAWMHLVERQPGTVEHAMFNAKYMLVMQELAGDHLKWQFGASANEPLIAHAVNGLYVVMPLQS